MSLYSCSLNGKCEEDWEGSYRTIEECQVACITPTDREEEDLWRIISSNDEERALALAPSDRAKILKLLTGIVVHPEDSYNTLFAYYNHDYLYLYEITGGQEYLRTIITPERQTLYFLILKAHENISDMVESSVFAGVDATDWPRHLNNTYRNLTRTFKGIDSVLNDENGGKPVRREEVISSSIYYIITPALQYYLASSDSTYIYDMVNEEIMPGIIEVLGEPKYVR